MCVHCWMEGLEKPAANGVERRRLGVGICNEKNNTNEISGPSRIWRRTIKGGLTIKSLSELNLASELSGADRTRITLMVMP